MICNDLVNIFLKTRNVRHILFILLTQYRTLEDFFLEYFTVKKEDFLDVNETDASILSILNNSNSEFPPGFNSENEKGDVLAYIEYLVRNQTDSVDISTKVFDFVNKFSSVEGIIGPIEFIEFLLKEPVDCDNILKKTVVECLKKNKGIDARIEDVIDVFKEFKQQLFSISTMDCVENVSLRVLADSMFSPVIGRERELANMYKQMQNMIKNNVILLGAQGTGKSAIVETFAYLHKDKYVVLEVLTRKLFSDKASAKAKFNNILSQAEFMSGNIVLFIDEFHTFEKEGLSEDIKTVLGRSKNFRVIAATTAAEYTEFIEENKALDRRFYPIKVNEVEGDTLKLILLNFIDLMKKRTFIQLDDTDKVVEFVINNMNFERQRTSPDKQIDIIDSSFSYCKVNNIGNVTIDVVAEVISDRLNIPKEQILLSQFERAVRLSETLNHYVIGQKYAVKTISNKIKAAQLVRSPKPIVAFFTGDSGVGKTELAIQLAKHWCGSENNIITVNMTEYMEEHTVSALLGSPSGYVNHEEGGRLVNWVRDKPYSVLLLDEFEKAHPKVADIFLQIFDKGIITDRKGRDADFSNVIVIMTANIGTSADKINNNVKKIGFIADENSYEKEQISQRQFLYQELGSKFRHEFLNRIDCIIPFSTLSFDDIKKIVKLKLDSYIEKLTAINLEYEDSILDFIAARTGQIYGEGYNPRTIQRIIDDDIANRISEALGNNLIQIGDSVICYFEDGEVKFNKV